MTSISGKIDPVVRRVTAADIAEALGQGLRDFQAAPLYGLAFGALYAGGGIVILLSLTAFGMIYLAYPLAAGFALLGPFVAIGLYEVSRRREAGQPLSMRGIWSTVRSRSEIGWMAFVTLFVFVIWMYQVRLLIALLLDRDGDCVTAMVTSVRAGVMSPLPMIGWAAVIVVLLIVSALPYFLGLLVTLPVLGHATWHLYRRIVAPVAGS